MDSGTGTGQLSLNRGLVAGAATGLGILIAAIAAGRPSYVVLASAPIVAWLLWRSAMARLTFVVVGGLFVFVSNTNKLTATKAGFFAGLVLVVASILCRPELYRDLRRDSTIRALLPVTVALAILVAVTFPVARSMHTGLSPWLRDAAAYALAAAVPLFLWDCDRNAGTGLSRLARMLLLVCGILSGVSFAVQWLGQRGILSSTTTLHILPGIFLPGALALVLAVHAGRAGKNGGWYALTALALPVALTLAGTRNAIALLICVVLVLFTSWEDKRSLLRWTGGAVAASAVALAALIAVAHGGHGGLERLTQRITSIPHTLLHLGSDPSYRVRAPEWHVAWTTFKAHPLLGVGPGHAFVWQLFTSGRYVVPLPTAPRYNLDSPVVFLAKFGTLGLVALAVIVLGLIRFLRLKRPRALREATLALTWYLVLAVVQLPFGFPLEDKGFTLGLILLGALAVPRAVATEVGFAGDWAAAANGIAKLKRRMTNDRGTTALLLLLGVAVVFLAAALAARPTVRASTTKVAPPHPRGKAVAHADAAVWAHRCGPACTYALTPVSSHGRFWQLKFAAPIGSESARHCLLLDTLRFRPTSTRWGWVGLDPIRCGAVQPARNLARATADADAAIWAYFHCAKQCRYSIIPVSPPAGLWELHVTQPGGPSCYLLDTPRFAQKQGQVQAWLAHRGFRAVGVDVLHC